MRIVFINDTYGTGSIGRLTKELADELLRLGHDVRYYYAQGKGNDAYCIKISNRNAQRIHAVQSRITGLQGYFSHQKTQRLVKMLSEFQPDVVHLQNLHSNYINLKVLTDYLKRAHIPTVITLHDCWFYTGKCTYYVPAECRKWMSGCGKCPLLHIDNVNPTLFFDTTHKCISDKESWFGTIENLAVVGVSDWITHEAEKSYLTNKRIERIYNWVDSDVFIFRENDLRKKWNLEDKKVILMVSSNLSEKKGYRELLYLSENLTDDKQIVYIGNNKGKLPIPSRVIHIEHTDCAEELAQWYSLADVCVNTTQYETFGMVTAEALSCGTPVIVYNNTASPELVPESCGQIVEKMEEIPGAIQFILSEDRNAIRQNCIQFAGKAFNKRDRVSQYVKLYSELKQGDEANGKRD